jgi:hypothetical protein
LTEQSRKILRAAALKQVVNAVLHLIEAVLHLGQPIRGLDPEERSVGLHLADRAGERRQPARDVRVMRVERHSGGRVREIEGAAE